MHSRHAFSEAFCLFVLGLCIQSTPASAQTIEDRISALISQMTTAEKIQQLYQNPDAFSTPDNSRLGIPGFTMADGPHGVREGAATSFPVGIGMAATWDPELARRVGRAMGLEFRGKGKSQALGPCLDLDRDPRNGRSPETGGEDPYLNAGITTAVVQGIQSTGCIATVKHYNANHREEGRTGNNILMTRRMMDEQSGLQFRMAVQDGGALSVMNAYNQINGQWCAENPTLLGSVLRDDWGFPFYVVSDWGSVVSAERAIKAGCDICMGSDLYRTDLPGLVQSGTVTQTTLDAAVRRVLRTKFIAGLMSTPPPGDPAAVGSPANQAVCLEAGRKSLVLLKNRNALLPLSPTIGSVALVGPNAAELRTDASGSSWVTPIAPISPRSGIEQSIGASRVKYARGCDINSADTSGFAAARAAAASSDVVIFCGGLDGSQEGEGFDRVGHAIELPGRQQDLINALAAANPKTVVVLFSGGICGIGACINSIGGLIYAFYPGEKAGQALSEVLFGDVNPSGKLPVTMPKATSQLPPWNGNFTDGDEGGGYRWFDRQGLTPQFPFGFGLSYTTFAYSNLVISPSAVAPGEPLTVSVDVTNTGARAGEEIAELYLSYPGAPVPMPVKQLKGFRRVALDPGRTSTVTFSLTADELYYFDESLGLTGGYDVFPGTYQVRVGGSSVDLPLSGAFTVNSSPRKPDLYIAALRTVPQFPVAGDSVAFVASVKNRGTLEVAAGTPLKVIFRVDGVDRAWGLTTAAAIPAGGTALLEAGDGPQGRFFWLADSTGSSVTVSAQVDPDNLIDEFLEDNNIASIQLSVVPRPPANLARGRSVQVSSVEGGSLSYAGSRAVDGNYGTRWSSAFSDPQWITVDLGAVYHLSQLVLRWEYAFAAQYMLRGTVDTSTGWTLIKYQAAGQGGTEAIAADLDVRFIQMYGIKRATPYGYSLYEFEAYGTPLTALEDRPGSRPLEFALDQNYPNPFNPATVVAVQWPQASRVKLGVYDLLGREVAVLLEGLMAPGRQSVVFDGRRLASGVYLCRLTVTPAGGGETRMAVRRMVLVR